MAEYPSDVKMVTLIGMHIHASYSSVSGDELLSSMLAVKQVLVKHCPTISACLKGAVMGMVWLQEEIVRCMVVTLWRGNYYKP